MLLTGRAPARRLCGRTERRLGGAVYSLLAGTAVLAAIWLGPLRTLARDSFAAHMAMHMGVVAVAAPLVALGLAGTRLDPVRRCPALFAPIVASVVEFVVVSGWHAPSLHHAARSSTVMFAIEQATFLAAGLSLWWSAVGGWPPADRWRSGAGAAAMLFTSIHMTLLGALFALTPRPLYVHAPTAATGMSAIQDQQLGGVIMLVVGGASYMVGGLWLTSRLLRPAAPVADGSSDGAAT